MRRSVIRIAMGTLLVLSTGPIDATGPADLTEDHKRACFDIREIGTRVCAGPKTLPEADIIFADGRFCQWPAAALRAE